MDLHFLRLRPGLAHSHMLPVKNLVIGCFHNDLTSGKTLEASVSWASVWPARSPKAASSYQNSLQRDSSMVQTEVLEKRFINDLWEDQICYVGCPVLAKDLIA